MHYVREGSSEENNSRGRSGTAAQLALKDNGGGMTDPEREKELALKTNKHWPRELRRLMEERWDYDMRYYSTGRKRIHRSYADEIPTSPFAVRTGGH